MSQNSRRRCRRSRSTHDTFFSGASDAPALRAISTPERLTGVSKGGVSCIGAERPTTHVADHPIVKPRIHRTKKVDVDPETLRGLLNYTDSLDTLYAADNRFDFLRGC
jgi:hypothetical protein